MSAVCVTVRAELEALVDGQLGARRGAEVRAHLAACEDCRAHHAEAISLPSRLAAIASPEPPPGLLDEVLRRVRSERVGPLRLWGPLVVELALFSVALWYVSGLDGLTRLAQRTASDVGAMIGWGAGEADLPAPPAGDVFLLLVCGLLLLTTLYHLSQLSRQAPRSL